MFLTKNIFQAFILCLAFQLLISSCSSSGKETKTTDTTTVQTKDTILPSSDKIIEGRALLTSIGEQKVNQWSFGLIRSNKVKRITITQIIETPEVKISFAERIDFDTNGNMTRDSTESITKSYFYNSNGKVEKELHGNDRRQFFYSTSGSLDSILEYSNDNKLVQTITFTNSELIKEIRNYIHKNTLMNYYDGENITKSVMIQKDGTISDSTIYKYGKYPDGKIQSKSTTTYAAAEDEGDNNNSSSDISYDKFGREIQNCDTEGYTGITWCTESQYDSLPDGNTRLTYVVHGTGGRTSDEPSDTIILNPKGLILQKISSEQKEEYSYDSKGQIDRYKKFKKNGTVLTDATWRFSDNGLLEEVIEWGEYDEEGNRRVLKYHMTYEFYK